MLNPLAGTVRTHHSNGTASLNRADFRPINTLLGTVDITFANLYHSLPINQQRSSERLWQPGHAPEPNIEMILEADGYNVVLQYIRPLVYMDEERAILPASTIVMVLHAVDINESVPEDPADRSNRREVLLDFQLAFTMHTGETVILSPSRKISDFRGAQIYFDPFESEEHAERILSSNFRSLELIINDALIRAENITVRIDLDQYHSDDLTIETTLRQYFTRANADKERYSFALIAYERLDQNHRALIRELWYDETGERIIVTSEIFGNMDPLFVIMYDINIGLY
jgi:hypothetical protein